MVHTAGVSELEEWDRRTIDELEAPYLSGGAGPQGSGAGSSSEGEWRAKRQQLAIPMDTDGTWLDIGCANGHLLVTLPAWAAERGVHIEPHGLELIPSLADRARELHPSLAARIWAGTAMTWRPPHRFRYVTALDDAVPIDRLGALVARLLADVVDAGGRLILSSYTDRGARPRRLVDDLARSGRRPDGIIHIDRPGRPPLQTVWFDA